MNNTIFQLQLHGLTLVVTPWKLIGYLGAAIFCGRWFAQLIASHRAGKPQIPHLFWYMSLTGSVLLLSYFTFSDKNDSVGIISNLFPAFVALYNLSLAGKSAAAKARQEMCEVEE